MNLFLILLLLLFFVGMPAAAIGLLIVMSRSGRDFRPPEWPLDHK